jgi:hypothetical protein
MRSAIVWSAAVGALLLSGCGSRGDEAPRSSTAEREAPASPPAGEGHAAAGVVPGSYEDWCEEHEVAETQCTRCDPSLIPAFQASGDWDAEHGLPLSQCRIHDPDLKIVRPPKPEGS